MLKLPAPGEGKPKQAKQIHKKICLQFINLTLKEERVSLYKDTFGCLPDGCPTRDGRGLSGFIFWNLLTMEIKKGCTANDSL